MSDLAELDADVRSGFRQGGPWVLAHEQIMQRLSAYENLRAVAKCTRFTMIPCTDRPEIPEHDYCPTCAALTDLDRLDQEKP